MEAVWIALIVAVTSMSAPLLLSYLNNRQRRKEKAEDYIRQDLVAAKVTQAAAQAAEAAKLLVVSNDRVAAQVVATTQLTNIKLDQIHTLVNSSMTAAMQSELDAIISQHALMLEVGSLKQASGLELSESARLAEEAISRKMAELRATLTDRLEQTKVAEEIKINAEEQNK